MALEVGKEQRRRHAQKKRGAELKGQHIKRKKRGTEKEEKKEALNHKRGEIFGLKKYLGLKNVLG